MTILQYRCDTCREEMTIIPHFYDPIITVESDSIHHNRTYTAMTRGEALCPHCGIRFTKLFTNVITPEDIIELALKKENKNV